MQANFFSLEFWHFAYKYVRVIGADELISYLRHFACNYILTTHRDSQLLNAIIFFITLVDIYKGYDRILIERTDALQATRAAATQPPSLRTRRVGATRSTAALRSRHVHAWAREASDAIHCSMNSSSNAHISFTWMDTPLARRARLNLTTDYTTPT